MKSSLSHHGGQEIRVEKYSTLNYGRKKKPAWWLSSSNRVTVSWGMTQILRSEGQTSAKLDLMTVMFIFYAFFKIFIYHFQTQQADTSQHWGHSTEVFQPQLCKTQIQQHFLVLQKEIILTVKLGIIHLPPQNGARREEKSVSNLASLGSLAHSGRLPFGMQGLWHLTVLYWHHIWIILSFTAICGRNLQLIRGEFAWISSGLSVSLGWWTVELCDACYRITLKLCDCFWVTAVVMLFFQYFLSSRSTSPSISSARMNWVKNKVKLLNRTAEHLVCENSCELTLTLRQHLSMFTIFTSYFNCTHLFLSSSFAHFMTMFLGRMFGFIFCLGLKVLWRFVV